ncbi:MAG: VCBS repeat-containing protein [Pyrinomonadaceae bacterium]|nr:VCBS repeat-containing protein [Pyrinomonadaceae bacterium]
MNQKLINLSIKSISFVLIFCASAFIAEAQTINLQLQSDYSIGGAAQTPRYAVGDVNNDGRPDLVTLNKANLTALGPIAVFLNNGAGGFGAAINITDATLSPNAVAIGDYNRDGNADLAIAQDGIGNGINIRLGNGTGNFATGTFIAAERGSSAIASTDFNGDGNLDVAICNNNSELRVLSGNGAGGFGAAAVFVTSNVCQDMLAADFNVDGRPDVAVSDRTNGRVQIFLNNGAGGFNTPVNTTVSGAYQMVTADFNRDCIPDLAATQFAGSLVFILLGNGAGGFTSTSITVTNQPAFMTVGDFNRDKKVDLAIRRNAGTTGENNLTILPGNGAGGFGTAFELSIGGGVGFGSELRLATIDANLDGRADIIIGRLGGFFLYNGNSALFTRTENDFDGDLKTDLSVFRPSNGNWFINRSIGGISGTLWGLSVDKPTAADYDGDGKTDLAVWRENGFGNTGLSYFFVLRSSNNTLQQEQFGGTGDVPIPADYDGDGRADVAVYRNGATAGAQSFSFYRPSATAGVNFRTFYWGISGDVPVRGDFDGDGRADAAVFRPSTALWYVQQSSNGQTLFQSWGATSDKRVPADYDGDGKTDFAVYRPTDNIWYILNSAGGAATYRRWGANTDALVPGDYNGDGRTEVAAYRGSEGNWYVPQCANDPQRIQRFGAVGDAAIPSTLNP